MNAMRDRILNAFRNAGIPADAAAAEKLAAYYDALVEQNGTMNLTRITEPDDFISRHYTDSACVVNFPEFQAAETVLDLGTGGGFPGVPLAVLAPEKRFTLVDSVEKKLRFVREACRDLGIENIETIHARAEDLGRDPRFREKSDLCVSRAVAELSVLSEYCLPFVRVGGSFIAYKGPDPEEEIRNAQRAVRKLAAEVVRIEPFRTGDYEHTLIVIRKGGPVPRMYPRKAGTPRKMPL